MPEQGTVQNKPMLSDLLTRKSFAQEQTPQGDHANGKCAGLGRDKDETPIAFAKVSCPIELMTQSPASNE
jgi:hypothetical protein